MLTTLFFALCGVLLGLPIGWWIRHYKAKHAQGTKDCYGNPIGDRGYLETNISKITGAWLNKAKAIDNRDIGGSFATVLHQDLQMQVVNTTGARQALSPANAFQYKSRIKKRLCAQLNHYHHEALEAILDSFDEHENKQFILYFLNLNLIEQSDFIQNPV